MKRTLPTLLALSLGLQLLAGCANTASADTGDAEALDTSAGVLATTDLSEYTNLEALVVYTDGTSQVVSYRDENTLSEGLTALSQEENVSLVQPNYSYENKDFETRDALFDEQWALNNDGSFTMEEQRNDYPVFDSPFGDPAAPGQWTPPANGGRPGGRAAQAASSFSTARTSVTAQAGIDVNAQEAWDLYDGGSRQAVIALIDTGVDYTHEDLAGHIWTNEDEIAGNGVDDDGNGYVDDVYGWNFYSGNNQVYTGEEDNHGTHGAGTLVASADNGVGIAGLVQSDNVKVMVLKALGGEDGSGTTASIIQAIQYAEANGASICNLSLGTSRNDRALYQAMASSDMLFVVAAGNDGADTDVTPSYPASYDLDNIISVANLNCDGNLHSSSDYGETSVDLAAPGSYILSTTPEDTYSYMTGTSMAAPMVTAAAAMVYSYFDDITLADVKEILLSTVQPLDSLEGLTATGGMLDFGAALSYDTDFLSGEGWTQPESTTTLTGSVPVIQTQLFTQRGTTYLAVQITDEDGDLSLTAYAAGTLTATQFEGGDIGIAFPLNSQGVAVFSVGGDGSYTFYAADSAGNETVKTVTVTGNRSLSAPSEGRRQP